jgi:hypothetical protein
MLIPRPHLVAAVVNPRASNDRVNYNLWRLKNANGDVPKVDAVVSFYVSCDTEASS